MLETPFTCPNGHSFTANAKIRARCPECGTMTRKSFESKVDSPKIDVEPIKVVGDLEPKIKPKAVKGPVLLRQGRPRVPKRTIVVRPTKKMVGRVVPTGKVSNGIVKTHKVTGAIVPRISGRPKKTSVAKVVAAGKPERDVPYWERVKSKYFR